MPNAVDRRQVLLGAGGIGLAAITAALLPAQTLADTAAANETISKLIDGATPKTGKVTLKLPQIAENGNTVQFSVKVDSPMSDTDYVKAVHVVAEGNPAPEVASYFFTSDSGKAEITARMRLGKTQTIRAVAVMNNGAVYEAREEVKVTIGGCGG
ncbi:MAG: thiosulfate oxidation carrier protein SoxY [Alphaproteobacteria bacterium]